MKVLTERNRESHNRSWGWVIFAELRKIKSKQSSMSIVLSENWFGENASVSYRKKKTLSDIQNKR